MDRHTDISKPPCLHCSAMGVSFLNGGSYSRRNAIWNLFNEFNHLICHMPYYIDTPVRFYFSHNDATSFIYDVTIEILDVCNTIFITQLYSTMLSTYVVLGVAHLLSEVKIDFVHCGRFGVGHGQYHGHSSGQSRSCGWWPVLLVSVPGLSHMDMDIDKSCIIKLFVFIRFKVASTGKVILGLIIEGFTVMKEDPRYS